MTDLDLTTRQGLPDALRVLLTDIPREAWETHPNFGEMVQFWLQRHLMFRDLLGRLQGATDEFVSREIGFETFAPRLSRFGGFFLQELHMHHHVEDSHYFPRLQALDARLGQGFDILDSDHHALDGLLNGFAEGANAALQAEGAPARHEAAAGGYEVLQVAAPGVAHV